jgi:hypothetical protein
MKLNRALVAALYSIAFMLMLIPLSEAALSVWPMRAGTASWRYGATGLVSRALMTPLLGLAIASGAAIALDHRRMLRTLAVAAALGTLLLVSASGLFALDALEVHNRVRLDARSAFYAATLQATAKIAAAITVLALVAIGGWRASVMPAGQRSTASHGRRHGFTQGSQSSQTA